MNLARLKCDAIAIVVLELCFFITSSSQANNGFEEYKWSPQRSKAVSLYLKPAVRVNNSSGTIVYYSQKTKYAYVLTCAHIIHEPKEKQEIELFWNTKNLKQKIFKAVILCIDETEDLAFLRFKPGFVLPYAPIASSSKYNYPSRAPRGQQLISTGRDEGTDPAAYAVEVMKPYHGEWWLTTKTNRPRGGRSGGGLFNKEGYIVGVTYGHAKAKAKEADRGYFTPLWRINRFAKRYKMSWILKIQQPAQAIPVINRNKHTSYKRYEHSYIPLPISMLDKHRSF